uniref:Cation-transporting P-type ATPase N-terminal domain-containing protein n=1 Tax=Hucho hucho TaxID=62062 RepID=A0A4W5NY61_9TELE
MRYTTSVTKGLTSSKAVEVLERDGPNELLPPKGTPEYVKFAQQLAGGLQCLMWVAAIICFIAFGIEFSRGTLGCFDDCHENFVLSQNYYIKSDYNSICFLQFVKLQV